MGEAGENEVVVKEMGKVSTPAGPNSSVELKWEAGPDDRLCYIFSFHAQGRALAPNPWTRTEVEANPESMAEVLSGLIEKKQGKVSGDILGAYEAIRDTLKMPQTGQGE